MNNRFPLKSKTILIVSNEPWGKQWYVKHHWANELSNSNKVYFVNPASKFTFKWNNLSVNVIKSSLHSIGYYNILPFTGRFKITRYFNELLSAILIKNKIPDTVDLIISFDPFRPYFPSFFNAVSVYYAVDDYIINQEYILAKRSTLIIAISEVLAKKLHTKNVIKHGVPDQPMPTDLNLNNAQNTLFCGASFSDRIDYSLLFKISQNFPHFSLVLAGPNQTDSSHHEFEILIQQDNVNYLGVVDFDTFLNLSKSANLCLVPYNMDKRGNMINSLKIIQYLSQCKPVVSTIFEDFKIPMKLNNKLLYMAENHTQFLQYITTALSEDQKDTSFAEVRYTFAKQHFYSSQMNQLESLINTKLS